MNSKNTAWLGLRIPSELMERIRQQQETEQRGSRSEMVRILLEEGLTKRKILQDFRYVYLDTKPPTDGAP